MQERGKMDRDVIEIVGIDSLVLKDHLLRKIDQAVEFNRKKEKKRTVPRSITDPDSGLFVKGDHKRQFAYEVHTACDKHGFVLEPSSPLAMYMIVWHLMQSTIT